MKKILETCHPEERSDVGIALPSKVAFTSPSRGMSEAKGEQESTETLSFRCDCERCRLMRGRIVASLLRVTCFNKRKELSALVP